MKTSIDTMVLQAKLTNEQMDSVFDYIHHGYYNDKRYRYNLHIADYGFNIHLLPHNPLWKFNAKITLQTNFFTQKYVPHSLIDILHLLDWSVTSIDIAFDFHTAIEDSIAFTHHGNVKVNQLTDENGHSSTYTGAFNPKRKNNQSIHYDRNQKEISLNFESGGYNHVLSNRYEVRLSFKMDELPLHNIDHHLIMKQLKKYIFISSIAKMDTEGKTKRKFRKIAEAPEKLNGYYKDKRSMLKKIAKMHREPLEVYYEIAKNDNLYDFLKIKPYPATVYDFRALEHNEELLYNQKIS